jgi:uncharacterized protein (DUF2236 family)
MLTTRLFSPAAILWQVDREMALLLGGGRALLMQLAHPKIAAGVAAHSGFQADPVGRLTRTMTTMWSIVFDEPLQAELSLRRMQHLHGRVRGAIPSGEGVPAGTPFSALDPDLLLWVHATLIDSAIETYDRFVRPLSKGEREHYYDDSLRLAEALGVPPYLVPRSLTEFNIYVADMLGGSEVAVGPLAQSLAREILWPKRAALRPAGPLLRLLSAGLLAPGLRSSYDLPWNTSRAAIFETIAAATRLVLPIVPRVIRVAPHARRAERARAAVGAATGSA